MGQRVTQASPERPPGSRPQKSLTRARGARRRLTLSYASLIMGAPCSCNTAVVTPPGQLVTAGKGEGVTQAAGDVAPARAHAREA
eukprot:1188848-Prorocentrum_minimum.AAC.3